MKPVLFTFFAVAVLFSSLVLAADEPLQAGSAVIEISPPTGYRMSGYFFERLNTGKHDPLLAKVLYLKQGETQALFVACDLSAIHNQLSERVREAVHKQTGIPVKHIAIAATHSHTGPLFNGVLRDQLHEQAVAKEGTDKAEAFDFPGHLVSQIVMCVETAQKVTRPVTLEAGHGEEKRLSFNRRFHMKDGKVQFNPGRNNPNVVRVAGPIDPDVGLVLFRDAQENAAKIHQPLAALTAFAMHLDTVGGTEYSGDYPYYVQQRLSKDLGPNFVSLFGTGTCGDINHIDVTNPKQLGGHPESERLGTALAETVLATLPNLSLQPKPSLAVAQTVITAPLQVFSAEEIKLAQSRLPLVGKGHFSFLDEVQAVTIADLQTSFHGPTHTIEVQVFRLSSETAAVFLPGEVFVELGLAIKDASPFKNTLVIELCNDNPSYLPTKKAFLEGSYETVNSRFQPGAGEAMVDAAIKLLKQLGQN